jgi:peptidoglycan/LPS O-acetylase OafA/YrhL
MAAATLERRSEPPLEASAMTRLVWLDVLRGIAAMAVALHHATYYYLPQLRYHLFHWFDPGKYGVLVFFLVSGYIIPASVERHGEIRRFWIGRFFRIYPLLMLACAGSVLPFLLGVRGLRAGLEQYDPMVAVISHLTMLQDLLAVPSTVNVLWTLSYEMAFYLLVVAMFVTGTQRRSAPVAVLLALGALLAGGLLPTAALSRAAGTGPVVVFAAVVLVVAVSAAMSGRRTLRVFGGLLGGALAAVLVLLNGRAGPWEGLICLAVMFAGTVIYRAEHGQIGRRTAGAVLAGVLFAALAAGSWNARLAMTAADARSFQLYWTGSVVLAGVSFGGAMALRRRRMPRWPAGLGVISYSLYLLHPVLLMVSDQLFGTSGRDEVHKLVVFMLALVAVSWTTHRLVEVPMQRLGRRLTGRPAPRVPVDRVPVDREPG